MGCTPHLHYGKMYKEDKYAALRLKKYLDLLLPIIDNKTKVLEIGCYTADILGYLPEKINYFGIDFDRDATEIARQKGARVSFVNLNQEEIELSEKFDIIICTEVLEHLIDPDKIMKKIKELLKDNGHVLISLPNENTAYHRIMSLSGKGIDMCAFKLHKHLHLPTIRQGEAFISAHFKVIKKTWYINPGAKGSRSEWIGVLATKVPDVFWTFLARVFPGLFARGAIFLAKKY